MIRKIKLIHILLFSFSVTTVVLIGIILGSWQLVSSESEEIVLERTRNMLSDTVGALEKSAPDLIVSDICMSAGSGLDLAALCAEKYPGTVIILVSGHERFDFAREAIRQGVFVYLLKPLLDSEVTQTMERLLKQWPGTKAVPEAENPDVPAPDSLVGRAMSYIEEHYSVSLPLETVAGALYVSKSYLSDLFSKSLGMTFTQYKNTVRIRHAKELIRRGGLSMTEIAQKTGFDSPSRFSKVFHQIEGISPQQYQQKKH